MRMVALIPLALLAGCGAEPEPDAPAEPVAQPSVSAPVFAGLEEITFTDLEEHDLFGAGCSVIGPGGPGSLLFIAMEQGAWFKTGGEIVGLDPDPKSAELPYLARDTYASGAFWAQLKPADEGEVRGEEVTDYDGTLTIRDGEGAVLVAQESLIECGA